MTVRWIALSEAARRARASYYEAHTAVLRGILKGRQGRNKRWMVTDASVRLWCEKRQRDGKILVDQKKTNGEVTYTRPR